mgnify:CR=1 FL=1
MKRFVTYDGTNVTEAGFLDIRSKKGWLLFYWQEIDKEVYPTFEGWLSDMLKTGILSDITDKVLVYGKNKKNGKISVIEVCNDSEDAEKFCESWGWMFDDGREDYYMMIEDPDNKMFRVDVFGGDHKKAYFDTPEEAREYGKYKAIKGNIVFLLQHVFDGKYDVVDEIK